MSASDTSVESVTHGTTWSIYFRDPEGNRLEVFADTPWHVSQPCRFSIDLELNDDELYEYTEEKIRNLPGFKSAEEWRKSHKVVVTDTHARDNT
jgi:catechol-2,3-dioxygenase